MRPNPKEASGQKTPLQVAPWQGAGKQPDRDSLQAAIERFVSLGMRVFPVFGLDRYGQCTCGKGRACTSAGKHPKLSIKEATSDAAQIERWLDHGMFANLGVACGEFGDQRSGTFFVLDIDDRHKGHITLQKWVAEHGELPRTVEVTTGGGGKHYFFRLNDAEPVGNSAGTLGEGVDVRGRGGFVVAPPSLHRVGDNYEFASPTNEFAIADAPAWLVDKIRSGRAKNAAKYDPKTAREKVSATSLKILLALAKKELVKHPIAVENGTGEKTTFTAGSIGYDFGIPIDDFMPLIEEYNADCKPPWDYDELRAKVEHAYEYNDSGFPFGWRLTAPLERDGRRVFVISPYEAENVDNLFLELAKREDVFVFNQRLARLVWAAPERPRPEFYTAIALQDDASRFVTWGAESKDGQFKTQQPPKGVFEMAVSRHDRFGSIPHLRAIVEHPFFRSDGSLVVTPGFDKATGVYLAATEPFEIPTTGGGREDAVSAWELLRDLVSEFPFRNDADLAAWLAFTITPMLRFAFDGPVPLVLFDATTPGAGKGLIMDVASTIAIGRTVPRSMLAPDLGEQRKLITSALATAPQVYLFDNVTAGVGGPVIEGLITSDHWRDRILSRSELVTFRNDTIWCVTANNARVEGDAARRILCIRLEPPLERPETRTFKRPDIVQYAKAERKMLLSAAIQIVQAYFNSGASGAKKLGSWGSFEGWYALVGSCVHWVTGVDPAANRTLLSDNDIESELAAELVAALSEHGDVSATQIAAGIILDEAAWDRVKAVIAELMPTRPNTAPTAHQIGRKLAALRGRVFNGLRLVQHRGRNKRAWCVEPVSANGAHK